MIQLFFEHIFISMARGFIMLDIDGYELTAADRNLINASNVGGVILFSRNYKSPEQIINLIDDIRNIKSPSPLIAVDHEGGRVQRFRDGFTSIPPMRKVGQFFDINSDKASKLANTIGWIIGSELRSVGVDICFAPCVDLDWGISSVIGDRSFHRDKLTVEILSHQFSLGMISAGMSPVAKHFPGHGSVAADSHTDLPVDRRDFSDLLDDIFPYEGLIRKKVIPAIMMSHVIYKEADPFPASLSEYWINNHLRNQLQYNGVIFCDDLSMQALRGYGSVRERATAALNAGCDMILVCNDRESAEQVVESHKNYRNYGSMVRLASIHGKKSITRDALLLDDKWINARDYLMDFNEKPNLELSY